MNKVFVLFSILVLGCYTEKIKVSIYLESLCSDSKAFVVKQFYPAYLQLSSNLEVDMVPYGLGYHTHNDGVWNFQCQHGQKECYGNRVQTCALAQDAPFDTIMAWFNCTYTDINPTSYLAMMWCAEDVGLSWDDLEFCSKGSEIGYELLAEMGDRTHAVVPEITYVPTIIFNDVYDADLHKSAEFDFKNTACLLFQEKPEPCLEEKSMN